MLVGWTPSRRAYACQEPELNRCRSVHFQPVLRRLRKPRHRLPFERGGLFVPSLSTA
jgi:hypothetical protein